MLSKLIVGIAMVLAVALFVAVPMLFWFAFGGVIVLGIAVWINDESEAQDG